MSARTITVNTRYRASCGHWHNATRLVTVCPTCHGALGYHKDVPMCRCEPPTDPQPARLPGDYAG